MAKSRSKKSRTAPAPASRKPRPEPKPGGDGESVIFTAPAPASRIDEVVEIDMRDARDKPLLAVTRGARIFIRGECVSSGQPGSDRDAAVARKLTMFLYSAARRPSAGKEYHVAPGKGGKGIDGGADGQDGAIRFNSNDGTECLAFAKGVAFVKGKPANNAVAYKALVEWIESAFAPREF